MRIAKHACIDNNIGSRFFKDKSDGKNQQESQDGYRNSDQGGIKVDQHGFSLIFSPEFQLLDSLCFSKFRTEIEYTAHPETCAKVHSGLQETLCAQRSREKKQQPPGGGNAENPKSQPEQDRQAQPKPAAAPASIDLGRPDVANTRNILIIGSHK
jgi:hypothetical protein